MPEVGSWPALLTFAALVVAQSVAAVLWVQRQTAAVETRATAYTDKEVARLERSFDAERVERQREFDRIERALEGFSAAVGQMGLVAQSVEHLAERLGDHAHLTDRNIDELKHTIRSVDGKIDAMTLPTRRRASASAEAGR